MRCAAAVATITCSLDEGHLCAHYGSWGNNLAVSWDCENREEFPRLCPICPVFAACTHPSRHTVMQA